jgi:hypothetical protein
MTRSDFLMKDLYSGSLLHSRLVVFEDLEDFLKKWRPYLTETGSSDTLVTPTNEQFYNGVP